MPRPFGRGIFRVLMLPSGSMVAGEIIVGEAVLQHS